ncbi:pseudouridine synthase [Kriegella aquimaris]|uniref:Pseudouridine synthase n=1 Tax=Kriegella aquimaris TaxID=192904 RepID=A0A1G9IP05_9FLAO|nr:pseudouridine synthase [Kriegella aquimaris]SDL26877.1 23S rRNA pseudouridine2457 synthase [Kriegella aquimaris]
MESENHFHYKIHKPYGMLSQLSSNDTKEIRNKRFLTELYDFPKGGMPIGRLDEKSEGLLLFTSDGKLSDTINRSGLEKEYYAQLDGVIDGKAILKLQSGVEIGFSGKKYQTKACVVKQLLNNPEFTKANEQLRIGRHRPSSWISITLTEGKFRQVRKMTAAVGFPTLRLVRVRIANIHLNDLPPGKVLPLTPKFYEQFSEKK